MDDLSSGEIPLSLKSWRRKAQNHICIVSSDLSKCFAKSLRVQPSINRSLASSAILTLGLLHCTGYVITCPRCSTSLGPRAPLESQSFFATYSYSTNSFNNPQQGLARLKTYLTSLLVRPTLKKQYGGQFNEANVFKICN